MLRQVTQKFMVGASCLLLAFAISACGGHENTNNSSNANSNGAASSPSPRSTQPSVSEDNALKNKVEANLTKYQVSGITVEVSNGEVTLKGDIPRAKLQDAMKAANEASPKKVNNQMNIK